MKEKKVGHFSPWLKEETAPHSEGQMTVRFWSSDQKNCLLAGLHDVSKAKDICNGDTTNGSKDQHREPAECTVD